MSKKNTSNELDISEENHTVKRRHKRYWTKERVLRQLKVAIPRISAPQISYSKVAEIDKNLALSAVHIFGSWENLLESAGIPKDRWPTRGGRTRDNSRPSAATRRERNFVSRYTNSPSRQSTSGSKSPPRADADPKSLKLLSSKKSVIAQLQERAATGKSVTYKNMIQDDWAFAKLVMDCFPTWDSALFAAGIEGVSPSFAECKVWNRDTVLNELRQIQSATQGLTSTKLRTLNPKLFELCQRIFGSVEAAIDFISPDGAKRAA